MSPSSASQPNRYLLFLDVALAVIVAGLLVARVVLLPPAPAVVLDGASPATVTSVAVGSLAWQEGLRPGAQVDPFPDGGRWTSFSWFNAGRWLVVQNEPGEEPLPDAPLIGVVCLWLAACGAYLMLRRFSLGPVALGLALAVLMVAVASYGDFGAAALGNVALLRMPFALAGPRPRTGLLLAGVAVMLSAASWLVAVAGLSVGLSQSAYRALVVVGLVLGGLALSPLHGAWRNAARRQTSSHRSILSLLLDELVPGRSMTRRDAAVEVRHEVASSLHREVLPILDEALRAIRESPDVALRDVAAARRILSDASHELWPMALEVTGLVGALEQLAEQVQQRSGIEVRLTVEGDHRPPTAVEQVAYRIAQLALDNVQRHSSARLVEMELQVAPAEVRLAIADDGRGQPPVDLAALAAAGHRGLAEMHYLADSVAGELTLAKAELGGLGVGFRWRP